MPAHSDVTVLICSWPERREVLSRLRHEVFVVEQGVPAELEMDALDAAAVHAIATDSAGAVIGTGRLILEGAVPRIGRMAVRRDRRRDGIGARVLEVLCEEARRRGYRCVMLHAQVHASAFYLRHGFVPHGEEFFEAGIAHQEMRKPL